MADKTGIQWTEQTWNPTTGCDRVSPGCDNCYALKMAKRLKGMGSAKYQTDGDPRTSGPGFGLAMHEDTLTDPLRWKKPRRVFVNSMSDLFHARVPVEFITDVWRVMEMTPQHTYQILTKRPQRVSRVLTKAHWVLGRTEPLPNVWLGTSVENQKYADIRIPALLDTPAAVRFLSCEPMVGPVDLTNIDRMNVLRSDDTGYENGLHWVDGPAIDWVIIGGESGPGARPFDPNWAADLIQDSRAAGAAPFVKQLGSVWARENNASDIKGGKPSDWPAALRVREFPDTGTSQATS